MIRNSGGERLRALPLFAFALLAGLVLALVPAARADQAPAGRTSRWT